VKNTKSSIYSALLSVIIALIVLLFVFLVFIDCKRVPDYLNSQQHIEKGIESLLAELTLEEKVSMLSGVNDFYTLPIERLKIPSLRFADGPLGAKEGNGTAFPAGVCMAATWNQDLIEKVGEVIAEECLQKDIDVILGPTLNIHRLPGGGRNFESFGKWWFLI